MQAPNPLRRGLVEDRTGDACAVVIFGASGDLTRRKLMPALYNLAVSRSLPSGFAVVGVARRDHVLRVEGIFGSVFGDAPLYEKFYVGDYTDLRPHRALDLAFDRRAAPNFLGTSIAEVRYGDYAARLNAEYRIPLYRGRKSIYGVDFFSSVGLYSVANGRDITSPARGYDGFAKVPIDLTFNTGLKADTAAGGFSIGIANFIGFIPIRSGAQ